MTNLTKDRRFETIESVIAATELPAQKQALIDAVKVKVREIMRLHLPKGFEQATATLPTNWFGHITSVSIQKDCNPVDLLSMREPDVHRWSYPSFPIEPISMPHYCQADLGMRSLKTEKGEPDNLDSWEVHLTKEIKEANKLRIKEEKLREQLNGFLNSVKTYKQVIEKMPELEKHLPAVAGKQYPVAVSVTPLLNMLTGLGFDQSVPA
jgi:hypothetical protein